MAPQDSIPTAPGALPLLGHLLPLLRDPLALLRSLPERGPLVGIRLGPARMVVVCDPLLTQQVLRDDRTFDKGGPFFDRFRELTGNGLGASPHSLHRRQRRLVQPAFHASRLSDYGEAMTTHIAAVTGSWKDGQILDVHPEMMRITSETAVELLFAGTLPMLAVQRTLEDLTCMLSGAYRRMLIPPPLDRLPAPGDLRYHRARTRLRTTLSRIIAGRRASGVDRGDLLSALLTARESEGGHGLSDAEILDQVVTFYLGGTESVATTVAWALHLLAGHHDVQRQVYAEVDAVLAGQPATYADLPRLRLTRRVIDETLRVWGPSWLFTRTVVAATDLGGYSLSAGTTVVFSTYLIHHRPDLYPSPDRFDPERWHPERARAVPREAYIPFGGGARRCVGDQYGLVESVLFLATIAARWRLEPLPSTGVRPVAGLTLRPRGLRMRASARAPSRIRG